MKKQTLKQKIDSIILELIKKGYRKKEYSETTPIKLGLSQTDFSKISYITEKRQNQLIKNDVVKLKQFTKEDRKKYFYHTSASKLLSKFINIDSDDLQPFADKLSQYIIEQKKIDLKVFKGTDIARIYNMSNHRFGESSCMQEKHKSYFEIYEHLPVKLFALIENGELLARCLVWYNERHTKTDIYIDRIYSFGNDEISKIMYRKIIFKIREVEKISKDTPINAYNCRFLNWDSNTNYRSYPSFQFVKIDNDIEVDELEALPYLDTFQFSCGNYLQTDSDSDTRYQLNCTGGTYSDVEQIVCECCGVSVDEDTQIWVEDLEETRCEHCAIYSSVDDVWYAEENCTYISGNIESYVHNDHIQN